LGAIKTFCSTHWLRLALTLILSLVCLNSWVMSPPGLTQLPAVGSAAVEGSTQSSSIDQLRQQQQQLDRQRSQIRTQHDRVRSQEQNAQNRLSGLKDNIQVTAAQIAQNEQQLQDASQRLLQIQSELAQSEKAYQARQFATVARLHFLQRQQGKRGWAVLLQSRNLNDFLDRRRQLKLVYQADRKILAGLKAASDDVNRRRHRLETQKNQIALLTEELQAQKAEYQAQAETQQSLVDRLRQDRRALEAAETQLDRDSASITLLIRQRLPIRDRVIFRGTGQLGFPSDAPVTSAFGMRIHPILGYQRFHAGIDFGAAYGSTIQAADSGTVIFAGWYGGYGRAVIIDHGNSLTTLYGHTSQIYVTEGETVARGQAIAAVGSTGFSTGPHLHFEVRLNGEPVNPLNYL
jgi:murein DD-endopeptidase MepM/ murein hydrolase activator NlpD